MADRNGKLAALMEESGFSHKALARAVATSATRAGKDITCDHTYVSRWLKGSIPRGDLPRHVADALGRKVGRSLTLDDIGMGAASAAAVRSDVGLDFPDNPDDAAGTVADLWRADLAESEVLVKAKPDSVAWHEASVRFLVAPADTQLSRRGTRAVGVADVEMLRSTADMFAKLDGQFGGGHARRSLIQYLHSDVRPLLNGQYSDEVGRYLHNAIAEALLIAGWMSYDSGLHGTAQRYFIQALRMAQAAGDRLLGSSILSAMSHQATFVGNYREAATLARAASMGPAAGLTPTLAAQFRAMEARALARLGDAHGCDLALAEAERQLSLRTPDSDPPWISYFDEVELAAEFGHCFRDLGRSVEATERGAGSIVGDGINNRSDFFATMVQAEAYVHQGEISHGFGVALTALQLGQGLKSARCVQYVREFQERITADMRRSADFLEFEEQAHEFRLWQLA
jgi:hypothetical protein